MDKQMGGESLCARIRSVLQLEMQMREEGAAGSTDLRDHLAALHRLFNLDPHTALPGVRVNTKFAVPVVNHDHVAKQHHRLSGNPGRSNGRSSRAARRFISVT